MEQSKQKVNAYQDNKIPLRIILNAIADRKFLITGLTSFFTVLAILYSLTLSQLYQSSYTFSAPSKNSMVNINELIYIDEVEDSVLSSFITILSSKKFQKEVFLENDFLTEFNVNNIPIDYVDKFINSAIRSLEIKMHFISGINANLFLNRDFDILQMSGTDAKSISNYLNTLIIRADDKNLMDIEKRNQKLISIRLDQIAIESEILLNKYKQDRLDQIERIMEEDSQKLREINDKINRARYKAKEDRLNMIEALTDSAKLAKSLGIIENNFKFINNNDSNSDFTIAIGETMDLPEWYWYGEKALLQRIKILVSRTSDDPFIPELVTLKNQINEIQNNNLLITLKARQDDSPFIKELNLLSLEAEKIKSSKSNILASTSSITLGGSLLKNLSTSKRVIIILAFVVSLILSILFALIMSAINPRKNAPT